MELFFANGGGNCFVISVANYWGKNAIVPTPSGSPVAIDKDALLAGLAVSRDLNGGTMLVVPDACLMINGAIDGSGVMLYSDYQQVALEMMKQSYEKQDRVAILDMPAALDPSSWSATGMQSEANSFYTSIADAQSYFSYGVAYGPALESSYLSGTDLSFANLNGSPASATLVNNLLTTQALTLYPVTQDKTTKTDIDLSPDFVSVAARIAAAFPQTGGTAFAASVPANILAITLAVAAIPGTAAVPASGSKPAVPAVPGVPGVPAMLVSMANATAYPTPTDANGLLALDQYLVNAVPLYGQIKQILASKLSVVPPSGIMAGVWTQNDAIRGVWNAPANYALAEVIKPMVVLTDAQQGAYNVPLNGNAIDVLRAMVNRGTVVWGARTLDGNSLDFRYIQVRRTLIYIEQSIKQAMQPFVFAANDGSTWATVTATISNFLTQFWQAGGLMGDKASDAFSVQCGVPTTMSGLDVLNGYMIVNVSVQLMHPAEFIELTFTQTMQGV